MMTATRRQLWEMVEKYRSAWENVLLRISADYGPDVACRYGLAKEVTEDGKPFVPRSYPAKVVYPSLTELPPVPFQLMINGKTYTVTAVGTDLVP